MKLSEHLVLFHFLLREFGYENFNRLRDEFWDRELSYDSSGHSHYALNLIGKARISELAIKRYDTRIREYEHRLREHRNEPHFGLKYFQYFTLLFTEHLLTRLRDERDALLAELNAFRGSNASYEGIAEITDRDLKKLAFWMATGSGKTLLMHVHYWQMLSYFNKWENILLITPNEGLSEQHLKQFRLSGIPARRYLGSEESLFGDKQEIIIIEITKLTKRKKGEGVSIDVNHFSESRNLVFVDEGHKGSKSEDKTWKGLRQQLTAGEGSFTLEYSATFGQIISRSSDDNFKEYAKAILFDYSYHNFYKDGYGKDFSVQVLEEDEYSDGQTKLLLTGGLLSFYEQLVLYERLPREMREYMIEKPLWAFVGSKVIGSDQKKLNVSETESASDVINVLNFLRGVLGNPAQFQADMDIILDEKSGLLGAGGDDLFKDRHRHLKKYRPSAQDVIQKVFHAVGEMEALRIKQADGEIGLRVKGANEWFGVINIGDAAKFSKKLEEDTKGELVVTDENFEETLFHNLERESSTIHILLGSKKFIEGWDSWRVSSMGLLNMGKSEGPQIIQLFGRGVRLKGKNFSLKREEQTPDYPLQALQTIGVFGLNANYMNSFLAAVDKEAPRYKDFQIPIQTNNEAKWNDNLVSFERSTDARFTDEPLRLKVKDGIAKRVRIDVRSKVLVTVGSGGNISDTDADVAFGEIKPLVEFSGFIDHNAICHELQRHRTVKGWHHMLFEVVDIESIVDSIKERVTAVSSQFGLEEALNGKLQMLATDAVLNYVAKFMADAEKDFITKSMKVTRLNKTRQASLFPEGDQITVRVPENEAAVIKELEELVKEIDKFYKGKVEAIPTIHFDRHLYSPIAVFGKRKEHIKTIPVKLNEGEKDFINHLKDYLLGRKEDLGEREVFVLRNLSRKGVGFFIESSSFYPDFIIWIVEGKKQNVIFVDPKGIRNLDGFNDDKIVFCRDDMPDIEKALQQQVATDGLGIDLTISAWILSVSELEDVAPKFVMGAAVPDEKEFLKNHVLFLKDDKEYMKSIFGF